MSVHAAGRNIGKATSQAVAEAQTNDTSSGMVEADMWSNPDASSFRFVGVHDTQALEPGQLFIPPAGHSLPDSGHDGNPPSMFQQGGLPTAIQGNAMDARLTHSEGIDSPSLRMYNTASVVPNNAPVLPDVLVTWGHVFNVIWRCRYASIALCLAVALVGATFASRLEKADTAPALFPPDNNVQYFLNLWYSNYSSSSVFDCGQCINAPTNSVRVPITVSPPMTNSPPSSPQGGISPNSTYPPIAYPPPTRIVRSPPLPRNIRPPPPDFDFSGMMPPPERLGLASPPNFPPYIAPPSPPVDSNFVNTSAPNSIGTYTGDPKTLRQSSVKDNTIKARLLWGAIGYHDSARVRDPFAPQDGIDVKFDPDFDLSTAAHQTVVLRSIATLFTKNGTARRPDLAITLLSNILEDLQTWCSGETGRGSPCKVNPNTKLPVGQAFHNEAWKFLQHDKSAPSVWCPQCLCLRLLLWILWQLLGLMLIDIIYAL